MKLPEVSYVSVLNLVISGIPSILGYNDAYTSEAGVLNLVISGIPSILSTIFF